MEFRQEDIARLVLGYLKKENCTEAYNAFAESSQHLKKYSHKILTGKPFLTRVAGMTLVEYLTEYAMLYTIVAEHLEDSNFYNEQKARCSLVQQLLYLLGSTTDSRMNSPHRDDNLLKNVERSFDKFEHGVKECTQSSLTESKSATETRISIGVNTTSLESLPGHVGSKSTKKKTKSNKSSDVGEDDGDLRDKLQETFDVPVEVLSQTLLEYHELHEKLAENINKEVTNRSLSLEEKTKSRAGQELDAVIKTVVQKTEADPLFDRLIEEIIEGSAEEAKENEVEIKDKQKVLEIFTDVIKEMSASIKPSEPEQDNIKKRLRKSKLKPSDQSLSEVQSQPYTDRHQEQTQLQSVPATVSLTSPENCQMFKTEGPASNVLVYNTHTSHSSIQQTLYKDPSHFSTAIPSVSNGKPQKPVLQPVFTEQDILGMPLYICENSQATMVPANEEKLNNKGQKSPEKTQTLSQYLSTYTDVNSPVQPQPLYVIPPKTNRAFKIKNPSKKKPKTPQPNSGIRILNITNIQPPITSIPFQLEHIPPLVSFSAQPTTIIRSIQPPEISTEPTRIIVQKSTITQPTTELVTPDIVVPKTKMQTRSTPRNASHVRQLNFSTPDKCLSGQKNDQVEIVPETDTRKENASKLTGWEWDSELRAIAGAPSSSIKSRLSDSPASVCSPIKNKEDAAELKKDALRIEEALCEMGEQKEVAIENKLTSEIMIPDVKIMSPAQTISSTEDTVSPSPFIETGITSQIETAGLTNMQPVEELKKPETSFEIINRNIQPKYKKKCNLESVSKKPIVVDEFIINVKGSKSKETGNVQENVTLSPTKLNANKRNIVEITVDETVAGIIQPTVVKLDDPSAKEKMNFISPSDLRPATIHPVMANRNLTPILETPMKYDPVFAPKTPGIFSPATSHTPFTKAVIDQLQGIDIDAIPTPQFPITPSIAITPALDASPNSQRNTDYSTSSSYYQPSDNEQNKSLERLIQEYEKLEERTGSKRYRNDKKLDDVSEIVQLGSERNVKVTSSGKQMQTLIMHSTISQKCVSFNKNIVGRKNINMVVKEAELSSDSSSSSEDEKSSTFRSSGANSSSDLNQTVIEQSVPKKYGLRSKTKRPLTAKQKILNELEEKRLRTIARMKENPKPVEAESGTSKLVKRSKKPVHSKPAPRKTPIKVLHEELLQNEIASRKEIEKTKEVEHKVNVRSVKRKINLKGTAHKSQTKRKKTSSPKKKRKISEGSPKECKKSRVCNEPIDCRKDEIVEPCVSQTLENADTHILKSLLQREDTVDLAKGKNQEETETLLHISSDDDGILDPLQIVEIEVDEPSPISPNAENSDGILVMDLPEGGIHLEPNNTTATKEDAIPKGSSAHSIINNGETNLGGAVNKPKEKLTSHKKTSNRKHDRVKKTIKYKSKEKLQEKAKDKRGIQSELKSRNIISEEPKSKIVKSMKSKEAVSEKIVNRRKSQTKAEMKCFEKLPEKCIDKDKSDSSKFDQKVKHIEKEQNQTINERLKSEDKMKLSKIEAMQPIVKIEKIRKPSTNERRKSATLLDEAVKKIERDPKQRIPDERSSKSEDNNRQDEKRGNECLIERPSTFEEELQQVEKEQQQRLHERKSSKSQKKIKRVDKEQNKSNHQKSKKTDGEKPLAEPKEMQLIQKLQTSSKEINLGKVAGSKEVALLDEKPKQSNTFPTLENRREVIFDFKKYRQETHSFRYNDSDTTEKRWEDYDMDCISKNLKANVYIEEIDGEVQRTMTFTPLDILLDISPSQKKRTQERSNSRKHKLTERNFDSNVNCDKGNKWKVSEKVKVDIKPKIKKLDSISKSTRESTVKTNTNSSNVHIEKRANKFLVSPQPNISPNRSVDSPRTMDNLMDFALTGDTTSNHKNRKSKLTESEAKETKTSEMHVLLKRVNLDEFLSELHKDKD